VIAGPGDGTTVRLWPGPDPSGRPPGRSFMGPIVFDLSSGRESMNVTQTNADGLKREFKIVVPAGHIASLVDARLVEVGRTVNIPGFRPGKVPQGLLKKKYGPSVLGEVIEKAVDDGTRQALEENSIRPAVQPKVEITAFAEGADLEFTVSVETLPEIELIDFKTISLEKPVAEVAEDEIEKSLQRIAENRKSFEAVAEARPAQTGDVLLINFEGKLDGVPFAGGKAEDYSLELGSGTFIPGFEDQLIGTTAGQDLVVKVTFPADYGSDQLAGKDAEFDVTVKELRQSKTAGIDDELAKGMNFEGLEALKQAIRDEIIRDYAEVSRSRVKRALLDQLSEKQLFEVPSSLVDSEFEGIWKQLEEAKQNGSLDAADAGKSDDELKSEYRVIAERRVRLGLVLAEVGRKNTISISQEDLNRAVLAEARRYPGQEQLVFQYYSKNQDALNSLRAPIFEDKCVDFILELASITEKTVSIEELLKDPDAPAEDTVAA